MIDPVEIKNHLDNLHAQEAKMLKCNNHNLLAGPSGYGKCTKCGFSELVSHYNFYNNNQLNK